MRYPVFIRKISEKFYSGCCIHTKDTATIVSSVWNIFEITSLRHHLKITRFRFHHNVVIKIPISEIQFNTEGLFFRKVGNWRYDVPSEMFQTDNTLAVLVQCSWEQWCNRHQIWGSYRSDRYFAIFRDVAPFSLKKDIFQSLGGKTLHPYLGRKCVKKTEKSEHVTPKRWCLLANYLIPGDVVQFWLCYEWYTRMNQISTYNHCYLFI
jgi:hypothetical protein